MAGFKPRPLESLNPPGIFTELNKLACKALVDEEVERFLWRHTRSPQHFDLLMDALRLLCRPDLGEWEE